MGENYEPPFTMNEEISETLPKHLQKWKEKKEMNRKRKIVLFVAALMVLCFMGCGKNEENPYGAMVSELGDNDAYALLEMDYKYNVLVTSDMLYDEGNEKQAAIDCNIYYYAGNEVKSLGSIISNGTAYPVTFSKDGIFAASGHHVEKYAVSEKDGTLYLSEAVYEKFDENGNEYYTDQNGEAATEQEYLALTEEYSKSQIVHFAYGASDCVNEFTNC